MPSLMNLNRLVNGLNERHPKLMSFGRYLYDHNFPEGTVLEITVKTPDGKIVGTSAKLMAADIKDINRCK